MQQRMCIRRPGINSDVALVGDRSVALTLCNKGYDHTRELERVQYGIAGGRYRGKVKRERVSTTVSAAPVMASDVTLSSIAPVENAVCRVRRRTCGKQRVDNEILFALVFARGYDSACVLLMERTFITASK